MPREFHSEPGRKAELRHGKLLQKSSPDEKQIEALAKISETPCEGSWFMPAKSEAKKKQAL